MWGNESQSGGGGYFNSNEVSSPAEAKKGPKRAQNIVPVMIKHLVNGPEELKIWEIEVQIVTFVAIVRSIDAATTKIAYELEDSTGTITGFNWLEADRGQRGPAIDVNTYVRVYGSMREQNQKRHVLILRIIPMTDLNELTMHLLEVTYLNLKGERMACSDDTMMQHTANETGDSAVATLDSSLMSANLGGMTPEQKIIFRIIETENETTSGIERGAIKSRVPPHMVGRVDEILEFMCGEGHIYTTLTDDHFKST